MQIGIIGSGIVGQNLGTGFIQHGHTVMMGTRDPNASKIKRWLERVGEHACASSFSDAARFGELLIVATNWAGTENALNLAEEKYFRNKTVIDTTNPLKLLPEGLELALGFNDSAGEQVQRWLPHAQVVKAFNTVGADLMVHPKLLCGPPDMFICGNNATAKHSVSRILSDFGWNTIDVGTIIEARLIEPMALVWIKQAIGTQSPDFAYKFIHRKA